MTRQLLHVACVAASLRDNPVAKIEKPAVPRPGCLAAADTAFDLHSLGMDLTANLAVRTYHLRGPGLVWRFTGLGSTRLGAMLSAVCSSIDSGFVAGANRAGRVSPLEWCNSGSSAR